MFTTRGQSVPFSADGRVNHTARRFDRLCRLR